MVTLEGFGGREVVGVIGEGDMDRGGWQRESMGKLYGSLLSITGGTS